MEEFGLSSDPVFLLPQRYDRGPGSEPWSISGSDGTLALRDILRLLLHVERETGGEGTGGAITNAQDPKAPQEGPRDASLSGSTLDTRLTPEMLDLIFVILSPSLTPDGVMSFLVVGQGNFVMVWSEEFGVLNLVDLDSGDTLTVKGARKNASASPGRGRGVRSPGRPPRTSARITIHEFLLTVRKFLSSIVQDNRFMGMFSVFALIWIVWRVYRHRL